MDASEALIAIVALRRTAELVAFLAEDAGTRVTSGEPDAALRILRRAEDEVRLVTMHFDDAIGHLTPTPKSEAP